MTRQRKAARRKPEPIFFPEYIPVKTARAPREYEECRKHKATYGLSCVQFLKGRERGCPICWGLARRKRRRNA